MWEFLRLRGYPTGTHGIIEWFFFDADNQKKTQDTAKVTMMES